MIRSGKRLVLLGVPARQPLKQRTVEERITPLPEGTNAVKRPSRGGNSFSASKPMTAAICFRVSASRAAATTSSTWPVVGNPSRLRETAG